MALRKDECIPNISALRLFFASNAEFFWLEKGVEIRLKNVNDYLEYLDVWKNKGWYVSGEYLRASSQRDSLDLSLTCWRRKGALCRQKNQSSALMMSIRQNVPFTDPISYAFACKYFENGYLSQSESGLLIRNRTSRLTLEYVRQKCTQLICMF